MNHRPRQTWPLGLVWAFLAVSNAPSVVAAADAAGEPARFFEESVRPLLAARCYSCHGPDKQSSHLRVDSRASLLAGGESGAAIEPGEPAESLLVEAVRYESFEMPPTGKLPEAEIAVLVRWVQMGAPWPGDEGKRPSAPPQGERITAEDRAWWAFQPLADAEPPQVPDDSWCRNEIDRFILSRLASEGLAPSATADRLSLVRRLYFDLTGLPPTPEEAAQFAGDDAPDAYSRLVDRLLDSPAYGQRWARHWLDLVRYAESDGYRQDAYRPHAWRYRDYVIRAFNEDKPYDRFVLEQLAGDELAPHDLDALDATGYLRHWIYEYNQRDVRTQWDNILIDITNVTGDVFLGLGMGCARCHDHKFDPILKEDYFALKAFFTPLLPRDDLPYATADRVREHQQQLAEWEAKTAEIRARIDKLERPHLERARQRAAEKFPEDLRPMILKPRAERLPLERQLAELAERQAEVEVARLDFAKLLQGEELQEWQDCQAQLAQFEKPAPLPAAFTVTDASALSPPTYVPGDRQQRDIPPGFLSVLGPPPCEIAPPASGTSTGRRTALARWIANSDNPLTARVIVNRVWQQHFGVGLVATASDFGRLGERPSHPALLDWLAKRFIEDGWRFKSLHRLIVNSATYRQASLRAAEECRDTQPIALNSGAGGQAAASGWRLAQEKDPQDRWLWRMSMRRLDAEQIRDAMLAVSGELGSNSGGPSVDPSQPQRSVFCKAIRNRRDPLLDAFDAADGFSSTDRRNVTTTATQSLLMINGPWPLARARALALRVQQQYPAGEGDAVELAYGLAYGRQPEPEERAAAIAFLQTRTADPPGGDAASEPKLNALIDLCHVLLNSNEFLYVD